MQTNNLNKKVIVSGGAGFVGSNLVHRLIEKGVTVIVLDNFSMGKINYLQVKPEYSNKLQIIECDLSNRDECESAFSIASKFGKLSEVWHFAANSDIPAGIADSDIDIKDTFLTTSEILRCMKTFSIKKLFFASSSAIYGDLGNKKLHENIGPLLPISNYGAMKLASEALICSAKESNLEQARIFRFPNVVGVPATHGVILDFIKKLKKNPLKLEVLGDGSQKKAYLHVSDLIEAMLFVAKNCKDSTVLPLNIGPTDEGVYVKWIAQKVVARVSPRAEIVYGMGNKGWVGDVPTFNYSVDRLLSFGWRPKLNSFDAVIRAIDEIAKQEGFND